MSTIHVVTTTSDYYARHTAVMLNSLLTNADPATKINIYITFNDNLTEFFKEKLSKSIDRFNAELKFIPIDQSLFDGFKVTHHFGIENYFRIVTPNILENGIEKAIFLDSDIIVKHDISKLWNLNIDDYFLAAAVDPECADRVEVLNLRCGFCFNSGVMLINLNKWRESKVSNQATEFIRNNPEKILWMDQCALNALLDGQWLHLDPSWNYMTHHVNMGHYVENPALIHFNTYMKPWSHDHPLKNEYFNYLQITPW